MNKLVEVLALDVRAEPAGPPDEASSFAEPVLDLVHLSRQTFGDHALEKELLTMFDGQAAHFAARLAEPCGQGDTIWRAELAHTLKGSARSVGAFAVGRAAESYEAALRCGDASKTARRNELADAIATARAAIAGLFNRS